MQITCTACQGNRKYYNVVTGGYSNCETCAGSGYHPENFPLELDSPSTPQHGQTDNTSIQAS